MLIFLLFLFVLGSCTDPEKDVSTVTPPESKVYLSPDDYQRQMDKLIQEPVITQAIFKSPALQAFAVDEDLKDFWDKMLKQTPVYDLDDWIDNYFVGANDIANGFRDIFDGNNSVPLKDTNYTPKDSVTVPYEYVFYGKERVVYKNATWEIITCQLTTTGAVSDRSKTGVIKYTRTNNLNQYTQFSYAISVYNISFNFSSSDAFRLNFRGLNSYTSGLTSDFVNNSSTGLTGQHTAVFSGSNTNSLYQTNISSNNSATAFNICSYSVGNSVPNHFSISQTVSNDYTFNQSLNTYYTSNNYWSLPNIYYNNYAGSTINKNNINNFAEYGYTWNDTNNSVEFDPSVFAGFVQDNIIPLIQSAFDNIFKKFPEVDATYPDYGVSVDIVELINQLKQPDTTNTGTQPVFTGDINVDVDVTFPAEFYKTYPKLTTTPAYVADDIDTDNFFKKLPPIKILRTSGNILNVAYKIIDDTNLLPYAIFSVSVGLITVFLL